jgi:hypothetical protein
MYEMTAQHIEILDRLRQGPVSEMDIDSEWDSCRKTQLSQLYGSGYIDIWEGYWNITMKGIAHLTSEVSP